MATVTEYFIKNSDNAITLTLTEDGNPAVISWTSLTVQIGTVSITRAADGDGITFASGILTIIPGQLTEDLTDLRADDTLRVFVRVISAGAPTGVIFGADDSDSVLQFAISDPMP